jgi:hypothetical protein
LEALNALFTQILHLCETAGLVKLGHVALDGTKIKANASKHKAMSYERMEKRAAELGAEVGNALDHTRAQSREELHRSGEPDHESKDGFVQAYNAQIVVDSAAQIIVAQGVTQSAVDSGQLVRMTDAVETNLGRKQEQLSADAGYCSEANLEALETRGIDAYVATGRGKGRGCGHVECDAAGAPPVPEPVATSIPQAEPKQPATPSRVESMRAKSRRAATQVLTGYASNYPSRCSDRSNRHADSVSFCCAGFRKVRAEWAMVCTAHNLLSPTFPSRGRNWRFHSKKRQKRESDQGNSSEKPA